MDKFSFFGNINGEFVDELYQRYQTNKNTLEPNTEPSHANKEPRHPDREPRHPDREIPRTPKHAVAPTKSL